MDFDVDIYEIGNYRNVGYHTVFAFEHGPIINRSQMDFETNLLILESILIQGPNWNFESVLPIMGTTILIQNSLSYFCAMIQTLIRSATKTYFSGD